MKSTLGKRIFYIFIIVFLIFIFGTGGYMLIEGWGFIDSIYMTIITIFTIGYGEVQPLSQVGRVFTIFLIFAGVGTAGYSFGTIVEFMIEGHLLGLIGGRRMRKSIEKLNKHYIVCGFGRVGEAIVEDLEKANASFVIIENNFDVLSKIKEKGYLYIEGDASRNETLLLAGIGRAQSLAAVTGSDATNIFIVLTARGINNSLFIISRANSTEAEEKMIRAGANRAISPFIIGGRRISALLLKPIVSDYLDIITKGGKLEYHLAQVPVPDECLYIGKSVRETGLRRRTGSLVMGIRRRTGEFETNPSPDTIIKEGDILIILGISNQVEDFKKCLVEV